MRLGGLEAGVFVSNLTDATYDVFRGAGARRLIRQRLVKFFGHGLVDFALQGALFVSQLAGHLGDRFGFFE
mgnify:CR=1 FL=1